jgi:GntR family transcriptional regulator
MAALRIDPSSATPIWSQIEEGVRHLVASGALKPGAAVPSVRDLARDLRINPATVGKAYQRLTEAGILIVRRGDGTYVADAPPVMSRAERARILREAAGRFADLASTLGVTQADAEDALRAAWKKGDKP